MDYGRALIRRVRRYAYTTLPVEGLEAGMYQFHFDVRDCAGQRTAPKDYYYFQVGIAQ